MTKDNIVAFHLNIKNSDVSNSKLAIIPGDPKRVERIAKFMINPVYLVNNREFTIWKAELEGKSIVICSTGIGGPSTSIAVEELSQIGIRTFLRVGTCGSIQSNINIGDIVITTGSVRLDGASRHFAPISFPAVSDFFCTSALVQAAKKRNIKFHIGITASSDTFYPGQERYDTYSGNVIRDLKGSMKEWRNMKVMNYEMESATLLTMCATQGLKAGIVSVVVVNRNKNEIPNNLEIQKIEDNVICVAIEAARTLISDELYE